MTCNNKHRSSTVLGKILLDLHHHIARLAWLIQEYLFLVKNESGPDEVGLFVKSLSHSFSSVYLNSK